MKKAFVFDIDGTLADNSHRLHYIQGEKKDWDSFYAASSEDKPIEAVTELARFLDNGGPLLNLDSDYAVVFCTGRPESTRRATGSWLSLYCQIFPMAMYMRKDGDHRPDYVVKEEMIAQMRRR